MVPSAQEFLEKILKLFRLTKFDNNYVISDVDFQT